MRCSLRYPALASNCLPFSVIVLLYAGNEPKPMPCPFWYTPKRRHARIKGRPKRRRKCNTMLLSPAFLDKYLL